MIACPECGSQDHKAYRSPKEVGLWTVRRHRCLVCRHVFATGETVLAGRTAEAFEELMPGSVTTPDDSATDGSPSIVGTTDSSPQMTHV